MKHLLLSIFAALTSFSALSVTVYVDLNATGANSGVNWTDAFVDLQDAIAFSSFGDDIWVAQGTYKPTAGTSRSIYFVIKNGTKIYGGFSGIETALNQRDVDLNVTILSGEIGSGTPYDNSYHVVSFYNVANQTRLDGCRIVGAYNTSGYGGGAVSVASSPIVANCIFAGNYAGEGGGAMNHSTSGILTLDNCIFDGNVGNTYGGGALRLYTGTVNITDCYFKSNQSNTYGGAIFIYGAIVNISNTVFAGNISQTSGAAIRVSDVGTLHLSNSLVVGNYTSSDGIIVSSTFSNNSAHTIKNCTIVDNKQDNGGGSSLASTVSLGNEASITNSIIYGNSNPIQVLSTGLTFSNNITQNATNNATGTNILYVNPQFILPGGVSAAPFDTTGLNYRLNILSQGIDYGANASVSGTTDLDGNARIYNTNVDLGAFEKTFCVSTSTFTSSAPYSICGGTPIYLAVNDGVSYLWSTGSTADSIVVTSPGTYSVIFEDINGCRGTLSATVGASANPSPNITFAGGSLNAGTFSSYQWYFNGSPIGGATNMTHVPIQGYGEYQVDVATANGCDGSDSYCLSPASLSANGPTTFCAGESVTLTVTDGDSHVWSTGSLASAITVNSSATYTVTVFNASAGCSVTLQEVVVVNPTPNPTISAAGQNLTTGAFSTYQWSFNGAPISGATSQNLDPIATGNGQYFVTVTNSNGCEATSSIFNLTDLGIADVTLASIEYYPNPIASGSVLTLNLNESMGNLNQVELYNSIGLKVMDVEVAGVEINVEIPQLESGFYFMTIRNTRQVISGIKLTVL